MTTAICLATYNGSSHLGAQLDSLFAQTEKNWRLLARDDGSADGTVAILEEYARHHPERLVIRRNERNLGVIPTFNRLLAEADADRILLCDQDDVWLPEKVALTVRAMREAEERYGKDVPILVHTDAKVVDGDLRPLADSLWRLQGADPHRGKELNRLLLQNVATGCTVMINRPLRDLACPVPEGALMHDWWLVLTAAAFGRVIAVPSPTLLYRQHGGNQTGARRWSPFARLLDIPILRREMAATQRQGALFLERFGSRLEPQRRRTVEAFGTLPKQGAWEKRGHLVRYKLWYPGVVRNLAWWMLV